MSERSFTRVFAYTSINCRIRNWKHAFSNCEITKRRWNDSERQACSVESEPLELRRTRWPGRTYFFSQVIKKTSHFCSGQRNSGWPLRPNIAVYTFSFAKNRRYVLSYPHIIAIKKRHTSLCFSWQVGNYLLTKGRFSKDEPILQPCRCVLCDSRQWSEGSYYWHIQTLLDFVPRVSIYVVIFKYRRPRHRLAFHPVT